MQLTLQDMKTLSELMDRALDLDGDERTRWLAGLATGPHAPLQPFLAEMLAKQADMTTAFLVRPIQLPEDHHADAEQAAIYKLSAGSRVGPYVLVREIGQGGMGAVWLADRVDGALKRRVALKLPSLHLTPHIGEALAERFARERDILAQLSHPNIARLYDAGVADSGRPYLALEYVEGKPLTEHCDALRLPVGERLRRFLQVANAVQYAHANLVIHRDLKPSNILVSEDGQVHLLDFGIAKLLDDPKGQAQETELTMLAGRALTLDYASPEQISGAPISTASDVYSMGVVLYQLLTGQKPHQSRRDSRAALEEAILAGDTERMSDAVRRGEEPLAQARGLARDRLARALAGDLDTIVNKAMKTAPGDRYATAAAFASDIERHLAGLPVEAQPDAWGYRAGKFVKRHRIAVAAGSAVVVALVAGFGTALWQAEIATRHAARADAEAASARVEKARADSEASAARRESVRADDQARAATVAATRADDEAALARKEATRADREALAARREAGRADQEAQLARRETSRGNAVQGFLADLFRANSSEQKDALAVRSMNARQLLDRGVERLGQQNAFDSDVDAALYRLFGTLYSNLDENAKARQMLEKAMASAERAHGRQSAQYAAAQLEFAWAAGEDQIGSRLDLIESARDWLARNAAGSELLARAHAYEAHNALVTSQDRALKASATALSVLERYPEAVKLHAIAWRAEAHAYRLKGDCARALAGYRKAVGLFSQAYGADNVEVGETKGSLATCLRILLRLNEADATLQEAVAIMRPFDGVLTDAKAFGRRAIVMKAELGQADWADSHLQRVQEALPPVPGEPHRLDFPMSFARATVALVRGDNARALALADQASKLYDGKSPSTLTEIQTLRAQARLGLNDVGGAAAAVAEARRIIGERKLPVAVAQAFSNVATEVAAAAGQREQVAAEQAALAGGYPAYRDAPMPRLMDDMSRALALYRLGRVEEAATLGRTWLGSTEHEMPRSVRAEFLLLAAEAAAQQRRPEAPALVEQAAQALSGNDVDASPRFARLRLAREKLASGS